MIMAPLRKSRDMNMVALDRNEISIWAWDLMEPKQKKITRILKINNNASTGDVLVNKIVHLGY